MPSWLSVDNKTWDVHSRPSSTAFCNTALGSYEPGRMGGIQLYINVLSSSSGNSFILFWHNSFAFREEDILISMLRLLEYERATVDAEGAIGLAALVAGKLPELKGKRYSSYCKQGTVAKAWHWVPWSQETERSYLVYEWQGISCPWTGNGLICGICSRLKGPTHRSEDHVEQDTCQPADLTNLVIFLYSQMVGGRAVTYSSTRHGHICQESILLLSACCLLSFHLWKSALPVVGQEPGRLLQSLSDTCFLALRTPAQIVNGITLVLSIKRVGKCLLASGPEYSVLKRIEPWLRT